MREEVISYHCPEMIEKNAILKFTVGICALNTMLREEKTGIRYEKEIENLMFEMKCDRKQIKSAKGVPKI